MTLTALPQNIEYLQSLKARAGAEVQNAVHLASRETGVDFAYLMEQAAVESNFDHDAKAKTSSATGLYQFIESTWLNMVKNHGDKYGLGAAADAIDKNGRVNDPEMRAAILDLRNDPKIASLMAAELASENKAHLERNYDGEIGSTELYLAHFLGAGGASAFLNATKDNPLAVAADIFPKEALANRNVFFNAETGKPRTLSQVYSFFDAKFKYDDLGAQNNEVETVLRKSKQPLRDFISDMPFQADISAARALGAIVLGDLSNASESDNNKLSLFNQYQDSSRSLFEQLQYRPAVYSRVNTLPSVPNLDKASPQLSSFDFVDLFSTDKLETA